MAQIRKYATAKDPRKQHPKLRNDLRKRVFAMQDHCALCGNEVDKQLPAGSPLSPELDEIIPIARGGSAYDIANLQLTHRVCNRKKGAKMIGDDITEAEAVNPIPTSRNWRQKLSVS